MSFTTTTVTGFSGFWNLTGDRTTYSMSQSQARAKVAKHISKFMRGGGVKDARAMFNALIGAAAGGAVSATNVQISAPNGPEAAVPQVSSIGDFGGNRVIDAVSVISRNSTAADVTELKRWVANSALREAGITYPTVVGLSQGSQIVAGVNRF